MISYTLRFEYLESRELPDNIYVHMTSIHVTFDFQIECISRPIMFFIIQPKNILFIKFVMVYLSAGL